MTEARRNVLIVAGVMAVLMALLPPWETPGGLRFVNARISWDFPPQGSFVGYSPLFVPPTMTMRRTWGEYDPIRYEPCAVSWRVLATQYIALALTAAAAWVVLHRKPA